MNEPGLIAGGPAPPGCRTVEEEVMDLRQTWPATTGTPWAALDDNGLAGYDGKRWRLENRKNGVPTDHLRRVQGIDPSQVEALLVTRHGGREELFASLASGLDSEPRR